MKKEKRFELEWSDTGEYLVDNETGLKHHIYSPDYRFHVRNMMNELAEENEQLKHDATVLIQSNQDYRKENEQLKSDLDYFKAKNGSLETGMFNLERENEQLRRLVEDAEDIILCQTTPHYQREWENIKKSIKGDVE